MYIVTKSCNTISKRLSPSAAVFFIISVRRLFVKPDCIRVLGIITKTLRDFFAKAPKNNYSMFAAFKWRKKFAIILS